MYLLSGLRGDDAGWALPELWRRIGGSSQTPSREAGAVSCIHRSIRNWVEALTLIRPDGQRLGIRARRRRPGLDRGVVLRALASIEHAVVPDDPHDPMADAGTDERAEFLRLEHLVAAAL